jgi:hypothetical protein
MEVSSQLHTPVTLTLGKELPVLFEWEVGWALEPVMTFWIAEESLASAGIRSTDWSVRNKKQNGGQLKSMSVVCSDCNW